jgi:hypothetical protein
LQFHPLNRKGYFSWPSVAEIPTGASLSQSGPIVPTITEFEQVVREYKLTPDQYLRSTRLREWARRNKNSKYIPEPFWKPGASRSSPLCNPAGKIFLGRSHRAALSVSETPVDSSI